MKSLLIVPFCQTKFLGKILRSIANMDQENAELLLVADGIPVEKYAFIVEESGVRDIMKVQIRQLSSQEGFVKAMNCGLREPGFDYYVMLNDDIRLSKGWLKEMSYCMNEYKDFGIVSSLSNIGLMAIKHVLATLRYKCPKDLDFSKENQVEKALSSFSGKCYEWEGNVAFCHTIIRKEVIEQVGVLDEDFSPGFFEDAYYQAVVRKRTNWKIGVCIGTYVWHHVLGSFNAEVGRQWGPVSARNKRLYQQKLKELG